jgi:hypothetical protein
MSERPTCCAKANPSKLIWPTKPPPALEAYNVAARRAASSYAYYAGGASLTVSERIHWRTEGGTWSNHHGDEHELDL